MLTAASKLRSNSADTGRHTPSDESKLNRVPKMDEKEGKELEESISEELSATLGLQVKKLKKKKSGKMKPQKTRREEKTDEESEGFTENSSFDYSEDRSIGWRDSPPKSRGNRYLGQSAYEVLGLRSMQPSSRPPILEASSQDAEDLTWAANDCASSSTALRRARPEKPFAAGFFDRLELLRRVVLSEIAKCS